MDTAINCLKEISSRPSEAGESYTRSVDDGTRIYDAIMANRHHEALLEGGGAQTGSIALLDAAHRRGPEGAQVQNGLVLSVRGAQQSRSDPRQGPGHACR